MSEIPLTSPERSVAYARRRRMPIPIILSLLVIGAVLACAIFGSSLAPHDPGTQDLTVGLSRPSADHWFGTDDLGRDLFSRSVVGARTAVVGPIVIAIGAMLIGSTLGVLAGYAGGYVGSGIMRWVDLMFALPGLLIAIVVVGVLGGGYWLAVATLIALTSPYDTRIVRGAAIEQRPLPYLEAARALGLSKRRIMVRHVWPNVMPIVVANTFLTFALMIVTLAALSFLGLGVGPGTPDWGRMLAESRLHIFDNPVWALGPGGLIVLTAVAVNLIGDWLYELLSDRGRAR